MHAHIINGRELATQIQHSLTLAIKAKPVRAPKFVVVLVGQDPASTTYVAAKKRAAEQIGIDVEIIAFDERVARKQLFSCIDRINNDLAIDGAIIQLPLPKHLDPNEVIRQLNPGKDIDGLHPLNLGKLITGEEDGFIPCTPKGIMRLFSHYQIDLASKNAIIIGRSTIVGRPLSILMSSPKWQGQATVTLAHSHTHELQMLCAKADILVCAAGRPKLIQDRYVKPMATVIDVGIHRLGDGSLCGDVDFDKVCTKASFITPVPGGVGPMTVAMLMENCILAWSRHTKTQVEIPYSLKRGAQSRS